MSLIKANFSDSQGRLESTLAYYGHLQYGSERITKVFIAQDSMNHNGCIEMKISDFIKSSNDTSADQMQIEMFKERAAIMVKRGGCSFVKKSLNVQKVGAKIAIVVDSVDEDEEDVIMIDNNNQGEMVFIPTYMVNHKQGMILWNAI